MADAHSTRERQRGKAVRLSRGKRALRSAAATMEYEFRMLLVSPVALQRAATPEERNFCIEAFLLHARNLSDFFGTRAGADDILARDFVARHAPYLDAVP